MSTTLRERSVPRSGYTMIAPAVEQQRAMPKAPVARPVRQSGFSMIKPLPEQRARLLSNQNTHGGGAVEYTTPGRAVRLGGTAANPPSAPRRESAQPPPPARPRPLSARSRQAAARVAQPAASVAQAARAAGNASGSSSSSSHPPVGPRHAAEAVRAARLARFESPAPHPASAAPPSSERPPSRAPIGDRYGPAPSQRLNPFNPPRHLPAISGASSKVLEQAESIQILDGSEAWQPTRALLDTGNEHLTCIDEDFAVGLGLYAPSGGSVHRRPTGTTTLRGIVPDAQAQAPVIHVKLRVRGVEFGPMRAALTRLERARPVLLGMDVIGELFAAGYSIGR